MEVYCINNILYTIGYSLFNNSILSFFGSWFVLRYALRLDVVFLVVAAFAHSLRVVRSLGVSTGSALAIAFLVVARLAHEFGAMLLIQVLANKFVL